MFVYTFQDLHLVDLEEFKYAGTNLTAFRLVDPENVEVKACYLNTIDVQY